jgi:type IV secretory pathway VirB2 component (pilin)
MKKNMGGTDRIIRLLVVVVIGVLFYTGSLEWATTVGKIAAIVGVIFLFTVVTSWCAIYQLVGLRTCKTDG